jgi:hypothetical protein
VNTTTGPQLPKYVSAAFGSLDLPWKPGHLRSALEFVAEDLGEEDIVGDVFGFELVATDGAVWDRTHPFPSDRVIRIFTFESPEPSL